MSSGCIASSNYLVVPGNFKGGGEYTKADLPKSRD